jgi:UDP-N-acetylmuramoylalanine--D-glutamate ligase
MKIAIVGYDLEGRASYDYFLAQGHQLEIRDQKTDIELPDGAASVLGEDYLNGLDRFDLVVRTAGLPPQKILDKNPGIEGKITSQVNEFFKVSPTHNIIGVTGTKGKGTTSTLIAKMLEATGYEVQLAGNIGVAPLTILNKLSARSWVVLELSSFQLSDLQSSPQLAVCLLVEPEHLDWHGVMASYMAAKSNLFRYQTEQDTAIYFADNERSKTIVSAGQGRKVPYFAPPGAVVQDGTVVIDGQSICRTDELKLPGEHNWQNVCAAVTAVWQITQDVEALRSVLTSFAGLPFRIEFRAEKNGIRYYNDSFASNPPATMAAIAAIPEPKVLIVGGYDRGLPLEAFAEFLNTHQADLRKLLVVGASGDRLIEVLQDAGFKNFESSEAKTMSEIVQAATALAQPGDAVVLSPGFASYDMFKNFSERGQQFNEAVDAL